MFERFTQDGRGVVHRAQEHARRLGHRAIGCEHLLLAVAGAGGTASSLLRARGAGPDALEEAITTLVGPGADDNDDKVALAALGIDLEEVRQALEARFGPGALDRATALRRGRRGRRGTGRRRRLARRPACDPLGRSLPFTPRAKRCLELSLRESLRLKHRTIEVDHIALALLTRDDTAAWQVLVGRGVDPVELRAAIEEPLRRTA